MSIGIAHLHYSLVHLHIPANPVAQFQGQSLQGARGQQCIAFGRSQTPRQDTIPRAAGDQQAQGNSNSHR